MTTQSSARDFSENLGKIHAIYAGGLIAFVLLLAILEQVGVEDHVIAYLFIFFTIAIYAGIGILARTMKVSEYYVSGRQVPAFYNGMASGAGMSGAAFVSLAGTFYVLGYDGLAFALGWAGGYVLVAILIAPYLRKFGAYTVADFLSARFGGNLARTVGIIVLICCSFAFLVAQVTIAGLILSWSLSMSFDSALLIGLAGILACSVLGGMHSVTWTQTAQYIVLIVAFLVPAIWMSADITGVPFPQFTYGEALQTISALETWMVADNPADAARLTSYFNAFVTYDQFNFFALIFCLMLGTAALPHILMRYFTTPSVRAARKSAGWSLVFILILFITAPAYAAFARLEVLRTIIGIPVGELAEKAAWIFRWGSVEGHNLVSLCGEQARSLEIAVRACGADHPVGLTDLTLHMDMIVLAAPEMAGLPFVISGLVAAGGLAAALSTANSLLLAIANAFSHDVYYKMLDRRAPTSRRLLIARVFLLAVAVAATYVASTRPSDILAMAAWSFSLAAGGLFPALVFGIWWKRCTSAGAVAGMIAGFGVTAFYLIGSVYGFDLARGTGDELVWAIPGMTDAVLSINAGIFGVPIGFLVMLCVSLVTPTPSQEMRAMIDEFRKPAGDTIMRNGDVNR